MSSTRRPSGLRAGLAATLLVLAACGTDAGSDGGEGTGAVAGSRALPGATVTVERAGGGYLVRVDPPQAATAIEALAGTGWESASAVAAGGSELRLEDVDPSTLLVRLTLADGAVLETAPGDFAAP